MSNPTPIGGPRYLAPMQHDPDGPYDRTVDGRPCRKIRTSRYLGQALVEYEDGAREVVQFAKLRKRT